MPPSALPAGARKVHQQGSTFYVIGDERQFLRDAYHTFLHLPWSASLGLIAIAFFAFNLVFALVYLQVGGIAGADGSFTDALSFSVQTMATIGYGVMHPASNPANGAMIIESMFGIIFTALATGLVFSKFSRPTTRISYSKQIVITQHEGKRTLMLRIGNRRSNVIVEAQLHVVAVLTTVTAEGSMFYRASDLKLVRDRQVGMTRGWTVMHVIDEASPLFGLDEAGLATAEIEIYIALTGIDSITMQSVHSIHQYDDSHIKIGYRFEDTLVPLPDGTFLVDLRNFDTILPETTPRTTGSPSRA
ncbi:MAG: ATP-sensitive inward rectifier potassium channel 10 [Myxococcales bacterium]|nr:ATP-sensitive inward rectifier potassium channel 10 [Myxococcales bacterium]